MSWTFEDRAEPPKGGTEPVPEGEYEMIILETKSRFTRDKGHPMIEIKSAVEGTGPWVWDYLVFMPDGERGANFALARIDAFYRAIGRPEWIQDEESFLANVTRLRALRFRAYLTEGPATDAAGNTKVDKQGNKIRRNTLDHYIDAGGPARPAQPPKPAQPAQPAQPGNFFQ